MTAEVAQVGVVIIGRNEGERLVRSIESINGVTDAIVYVDSGSTDDSVEEAKRLGTAVVQLPPDEPFTAGKARNAGFRALRHGYPETEYIQFVDGDCTLAATWLEIAASYLKSTSDCAIVCGNRKELHPERSVYNQLCDLEWRGPLGDIEACGGDFMVRAEVYEDVGGFDDRLVAGEEPEMCHRIARAGFQIHRLDEAMTFHDAAMTQFGQWVRRTGRAGYAYAARASLHWNDGTHFCWRENSRIVFWAVGLPAIVLVLAIGWSHWWLVLMLAYPLQVLRHWYRLRREHPGRPVAAAALFTVLGKWPEFHGQCLFVLREFMNGEHRLIEYK